MITKDPKTGKRNVGTYRMQVYDARTTGMHWQRQKQGAEHYREQMRRAAATGEANPVSAGLDMMARSGGGSRVAEGKQVGGRMEVAVAIGTEPAMMFSSIVPAPPDIEEYMIAGFLRQKPVELVKCETVDLEVPATVGDRARRLRAARRAAHGRPFRRSHRLLHAGRSVSRIPRHLRHASQESDLLDDHCRQAARWKTRRWARPSSASSCR